MPALGVPVSKSTSLSRSPTLISALKEVDSLLARAMHLAASRAAPGRLRDISLQTAALRTLQTSIGKSSTRSASEVASILGEPSRQELEVIVILTLFDQISEWL